MKDSITILDGGMGRELQRMGAPFRQPEWSALAVMEDPQSIYRAHNNFINAGAQIITINSYALVPFHIGEERFVDQGAQLIERAAKLARKSADKNAGTRVAGCLPPLFGSYSPQNFDHENAMRIIEPLFYQQAQYVDLWLIETVSSTQEAEFYLEYLHKINDKKPIWIAFSLDDDLDDETVKLRSGEPLSTLPDLNHYGVQAVLLNCCAPEVITPALDELKDLFPNIRTGAYANSFERVQQKSDGHANESLCDLRAEMTPERYLEFAKMWLQSGASIIGGCCGIGPEHIEVLSQELLK